jgi:hypothetical protein
MLRLKHSVTVLSLGENVVEFRFETGVERDLMKTKHVVVCLRKLNPEVGKKYKVSR